MTLLALLAVDQAKDVVFWGLFQKSRKFLNAEQDCRVWHQHKRIPVLGWLVARAARKTHTGKLAGKSQPHLVRGARWFVNTKTFEDCLTIVLSKAQKRKQPKGTLAIPPVRL
jgi:hypothetical protein